MNKTLLDALTTSLYVDFCAFAPELVVCVAIVSLLLIRLVPRYDRQHLGGIALFWCAIALLFSLLQWSGWEWNKVLDADYAKMLTAFDPRDHTAGKPGATVDLFGGMLIFDNFSVFIKV